MHQVNINLKHRPYSFEVEGDNKWGEDRLEIANDDDLSKNTVFEKTGYTLSKFLSKDDCEELRLRLQDILSSELKKITGIIINRDELLNYHKFLTPEEHLNFVKTVYSNDWEHGTGFKFEMIDELRVKINNRISELCGVEVTPKRPDSDSERFFIRIARPQSENTFFDNNPPHKDIYLDRLRNAVNIYFPIIGSNKKSSLGIIPYSHRWKENEIKKIVTKSTIKGLSYTVPCITDTKHGGLNIIRPQPKKDEVFLFTPYCIHGGAPNFSNNTRMSMEVRFWRK